MATRRCRVASRRESEHFFPFVCYASLNLSQDDEMKEPTTQKTLRWSSSVSRARTKNRCTRRRSISKRSQKRDPPPSRPQGPRLRRLSLCGMIVGFDHDDTRIFKAHYEFIRSHRHPRTPPSTCSWLPPPARLRAFEELLVEILHLSKTNPSDLMFAPTSFRSA